MSERARAYEGTRIVCTYEQIERIGDLGVDRELRLGRSDLGARSVEEVRALWPGGLGVDDGLVGGHVGELGVLGVARGDGGVHGVDIDGHAGADVGEERRGRHGAVGSLLGGWG